MRFSLSRVLLCTAFGLCAVAEEPEKTPLERLKALEKEMEALKKEIGEEPAKEKHAPLPEKEAEAHNRVNVLTRLINRTRIGGYLDLEFEDYNGTTSQFDNHHLNLGISSYLHERIFVNAELEFEHGGTATRVEQAYVDFLIHDAINFRGGVFLQPIGRMNTLHDSDMRDLTLRPLTTTLIIPTTWSDLGVGLYGSFYLGFASLNWEAYLAQGIKDEAFSVAEGLHDAGENLAPDNNHDKALSARVELVAFDGKLTFGLSGYEGNYDSDNEARLWVYAADLTVAVPLATPGGWISGPLELRVEAGRFSAQHGFNSDGVEVPHRGIGAYAQLSFHFFPPFLKESFLGLGFDKPTFTLVALVDLVAIDAPGGAHDNHQRRVALGFNFRPIEQVCFKVEVMDEDSDEIYGNFERDGVAASIAVGF